MKILNRWTGELIKEIESADLSSANLYGANLSSANLYGANLSGADLRGANLYGANLSSADLRGANLRGADLRGANLRGANLSSADLRGADLRGANLSSADLRGANLDTETKIDERLRDELRIVPTDGAFTGWKQCRDGIIVRVEIPADAKRSNATGRKCRAEFVKVIEVIGGEFGISKHDGTTKYVKDEIVRCGNWDDNPWEECSAGIHFFITKGEAERYC